MAASATLNFIITQFLSILTLSASHLDMLNFSLKLDVVRSIGSKIIAILKTVRFSWKIPIREKFPLLAYCGPKTSFVNDF